MFKLLRDGDVRSAGQEDKSLPASLYKGRNHLRWITRYFLQKQPCIFDIPLCKGGLRGI